MRYPVADMDLPLTRPASGPKSRLGAFLGRVQWLRLGIIALMLGMWPAIIFAISRFF